MEWTGLWLVVGLWTWGLVVLEARGLQVRLNPWWAPAVIAAGPITLALTALAVIFARSRGL